MRATKPEKPYKDFPLTAHPNGTWVKKIKGKIYRFGGWSDPEGALARYKNDVDAIQAGRDPDPMPTGDELTVEQLCDEFLESKEKKRDIKRLSQTTWRDYFEICELILEITGKQKLVEHLKPKDFDDMAVKLARGKRTSLVGKVTLRNRIRAARTLFKFAYDQDFIDEPLRFGQNFKIPGKSELRAERHVAGKRDFTAAELRKIINAAEAPLKAMILLGINCGFGNTDCGSLPLSAVDLKCGWIDFPRPKTSILRRCPLWPETIAALREAIANGYEANDSVDAELVFITEFGNRFIRISPRGSWMDLIADRFFRILGKLEIDRSKRGFYSLRRTLETVGSNCLDQIALNYIMGHAAPAHDEMPDTYRQSITDDRLTTISNFVRAWLFPKTKTKAKSNKKSK